MPSAAQEALLSGGALCLLVFGLALTAAYLGGTLLGRPMRQLAERGATASPRATWPARASIPAEDEVWAVSAAFTTMRAHLADVLSQLQRAGRAIGTTTEEILATSGRYEAGAAEQASSLNETSATTEELARSRAADRRERRLGGGDRPADARGGAGAGRAAPRPSSSSMSRMRQDNQAIAAAVARLNKRVQQIGKIVEFINGVADKSDLLALNAELEGTKAGEVGRGFSLVAAEMRRLAENVLESTKEIEGPHRGDPRGDRAPR